MPRPTRTPITFTIDGRDVEAPEGTMLVDAAKLGDVEIPVFCYEPKLGQPVGACRMCLVEVEGIPKLQTACSTAVKDGMVVSTTAPKVKEAQESVVEFLLVNHPLDCPVCDKGGECPLQDISYGWGRGTSRVVEPKRHFTKPIELSPLIAIDRERCILCYRCVRFSQEVSEDHQLVLLDRGADTYVGTFDSRPYVAPFSGNIIELCPVGALTSRPYRFRARPWDIEGGGSVCTLCPAQCNVSYTVRDERVLRTLARDNDEVDDGWLCDKGRFAYQAHHVDERLMQPLVRGDDGQLAPATWDIAIARAGELLRQAGSTAAALAGGRTTNEEGFLLQRLMRQQLGSPNIESRGYAGPSRELLGALHSPALQATVADLEFAHTVLVLGAEPVNEAPILDLRIRKGVRRNAVALHTVAASPSTLDPIAASSLRFAPGGEHAVLVALAAALEGAPAASAAEAAGADPDAVSALAAALGDAGPDRVVLYSESLLSGPNADDAALALLRIVAALKVHGHDEAGLLAIPDSANGRGLREVGVLPDARPALRRTDVNGPRTPQIADGLADGSLGALLAVGVDPLATLTGRSAWRAALQKAPLIAVSSFLTEGVAGYADVVFPAEQPAEQEGTITHPDGRLQRVRPAIRRPDSLRAGWSVLASLARELGDTGMLHTAGQVWAELVDESPFYGALTLDDIGGRGVRWPLLEAAAQWPVKRLDLTTGAEPKAIAPANGKLRLARTTSLWSSPEVAASPALRFLTPRATARLSPQDAEQLGIQDGAELTLTVEGVSAGATAQLDDAVDAGTVVAQAGVPVGGADELPGGGVQVTPA